MTPKRLRLRGLMSYTSEVDLDLATLPHGLIAVCGRNGAGKSTLLDALGPIPMFRRLSTRSGALKDYATARDAFADLTVDYGGHEWRMLVQIDPQFSAGRGKEEAFLYRDGEPLTIGRVTDYDEAIRAHLPPESVFFASAFTVQSTKAGKGAQGFFGMDMAERKALFAKLLGLEQMQDKARRAGLARKAADEVIARLDVEALAERSKAADADGIRAGLPALDFAAAAARASEEAAAAAMAAAQADVATHEAILSQLDTARRTAVATRDRYAAALRAAERQRDEAVARVTAAQLQIGHADDIRDRAAKLASATEAHKNASRDYLTAQREEQSAVARLTALDADIIRARAEVARLTAAAAGLDAARAAEADAASKVATYAGARERVTTLAAELAATEARVRGEATRAIAEHTSATLATGNARRALDAATKAAGLLSGVPCKGLTLRHEEGGAVACGSCGFLTDARRAADALPTLTTDLAACEAREATTKAAHDAVQVALANLEADRGALTAARTAADELTRAEAAQAVAAGTVTQATDAAEALTGATDRLTALEADRVTALAAVNTAKARASEVITAGVAAGQDLARWAGADAELATLDAAIAALPGYQRERDTATTAAADAQAGLDAVTLPPEPSEASAAVSTARARLSAAEAALSTARAEARSAADAVASARGRLAQLGDVAERLAAIDARRQRVGGKRAGYARIEEAFGPNGLQALAIDAAGPEVSTVTNDLLEACFGARFAVALRTIQEAGKGRVQKEVFDILVHDSEAGGVRTLEALSGGQQVLVDEALKLGIAVVNARRNAGMFRTLFRDEADGALDTANAAKYPTMLRRAMALGGFDRLFVISQRDSVIEACDARIAIDGGRVTIE